MRQPSVQSSHGSGKLDAVTLSKGQPYCQEKDPEKYDDSPWSPLSIKSPLSRMYDHDKEPYDDDYDSGNHPTRIHGVNLVDLDLCLRI